MSGNAGYLFYKDYYEGVDWNNLDNNKSLFERKSSKIKNLKFDRFDFVIHNSQHLKFTTIYPGLVLGTGYHHETGVKGEFKIGFYFDYTTGLPVIPGSSVKGLLRSVFPNTDNKKLSDQYKKQRTLYLQEKLEELSVENFESIDIDELELEIFEGIKNKSAKKAKEKYLPIYKRDIFFDAFPVSTGDDGLFSDDFITPHKNPLKNPIPLKFLKVSPGVTFQFNFDLKTNIISTEKKLELFKSILLDMGVGAKTNVGYGQLEQAEQSDESNIVNQIDNRQHNNQSDQEDFRTQLARVKAQLEQQKK